jgi:hypothetical protein
MILYKKPIKNLRKQTLNYCGFQKSVFGVQKTSDN